MDYVKPADVAATMMNTGRSKLALSPLDLVIRGGLAGAILAAATSLAFTATVQTNQPLVGALVFPVGLILIVLLGSIRHRQLGRARSRSRHRQLRAIAAAVDREPCQHQDHAWQLELRLYRQPDW